jgi:hypothetical protein
VTQQEETFKSVALVTDDDGDDDDDDDDVDFARGAVTNTEAFRSWLLTELAISYLVT